MDVSTTKSVTYLMDSRSSIGCASPRGCSRIVGVLILARQRHEGVGGPEDVRVGRGQLRQLAALLARMRPPPCLVLSRGAPITVIVGSLHISFLGWIGCGASPSRRLGQKVSQLCPVFERCPGVLRGCLNVEFEFVVWVEGFRACFVVAWMRSLDGRMDGSRACAAYPRGMAFADRLFAPLSRSTRMKAWTSATPRVAGLRPFENSERQREGQKTQKTGTHIRRAGRSHTTEITSGAILAARGSGLIH